MDTDLNKMLVILGLVALGIAFLVWHCCSRPSDRYAKKHDYYSSPFESGPSVECKISEEASFLRSLNTRNNLDPDQVFTSRNGRRALDLHGATSNEARSIVLYFLSRRRGQTVEIIPGRGLHSPGGYSLLNVEVNTILIQKRLSNYKINDGGAYVVTNY